MAIATKTMTPFVSEAHRIVFKDMANATRRLALNVRFARFLPKVSPSPLQVGQERNEIVVNLPYNVSVAGSSIDRLALVKISTSIPADMSDVDRDTLTLATRDAVASAAFAALLKTQALPVTI